MACAEDADGSLLAARESGEEGGALPAVLALVAVLSITAGIWMAYEGLQERVLRQQVDRLEARLAAEGALAKARVGAYSIEQALPGRASSAVDVAAFGLLEYVRASGQRRASRHIVEALLGVDPVDKLDDALVLTDPEGGLVLADTTRIEGRVRVGSQGVSTAPLGTRPWRGTEPRDVTTLTGAPRLDGLTRARFDAALSSITAAAGPGDVRRVEGNLRLDASTLLGPFARVWARDTLVLVGPIELDDALLGAGRMVRLEGPVRGRAQVLSPGVIAVEGPVLLGYPSILAAAGDASEGGDAWSITLDGPARIDGLVWSTDRRGAQEGSTAPALRLGTAAHVRGLVFTGGPIELEGYVSGTVVARTTRLYRAPTLYVGWLSGAQLRRSARPDPFALPAPSSGAERLEVLSRRDRAGRVTPQTAVTR